MIIGQMDARENLSEQLVHLARLALTGRPQDVQALLRKLISKFRESDPSLAGTLAELLGKAPTSASPLRELGAALVPVDTDTRLALVRHELPMAFQEAPILAAGLRDRLEQVVGERQELERLETHGVPPSRSLLFIGPPGVGKTMSARWLASRLQLPLISLDLATVMSSFLGKTGANIRASLDYAKSVESVLLLDEFDAIAKRRDDDADVGELKRLVNVLLQEIDDWPTSSLLIAASNHGELLDPAVWRRFDDILQFSGPTANDRIEMLKKLFGEGLETGPWIPVLSELWEGRSHSDISRSAQWIKRRAIVHETSISEVLREKICEDLKGAKPEIRKKAAQLLSDSGMSDRAISTAVGISRDTLRRSRGQIDK